MSRIFITGSADGLGQLTATALIAAGHKVVLHARNEARANEALRKNPSAETVLIADLSKKNETIALAEAANRLGTFDAVIHNAGIYRTTAAELLHVNTLAPYILTALMHPPQRLIYLSSGMHTGGSMRPDSFNLSHPSVSYSDTKLHVVILAFAIARKWPAVFANAVNPGWVPTKMGGKGAPDDLNKGYETQVWLATSDEPSAKVSGGYFHHKRLQRHNAEADDINVQESFLESCAGITGVSLPIS